MIKEAIKSALDKVKKQKENFGFMDRFNVDESWEVMQVLERQIPKKPIWTRQGFFEKCPICAAYVDGVYNPNYCGNCGQKLDRSEGKA